MVLPWFKTPEQLDQMEPEVEASGGLPFAIALIAGGWGGGERGCPLLPSPRLSIHAHEVEEQTFHVVPVEREFGELIPESKNVSLLFLS